MADSSGEHSSASNLPTLRNHDGFIEELFHLLWAKNATNQPCPDVMIPDTVIYRYRIPAFWYFVGADNKLKRKNKANIVNKKIYAEFTKEAKSPHDVVAYHISEPRADEDGMFRVGNEAVIRYFDQRSLHDFLFNEEKIDDGCLQKFIQPKGMHNSMIQAAWSPQMCLLERRINLNRLDKTGLPIQDRCATYDGGEHLSKITPVRGQLMPESIQQLCANLVSHVRAASPARPQVSRILLHLKTDEQDNLWLLWCSSVRLGEEPSSSSQTLSPSKSNPVCLQVQMTAPAPPDPPAARGVCPLSGVAIPASQSYFLTYKAIIEHSNRLANLERENGHQVDFQVPPLLSLVLPDLDVARYATEKHNPLFLYQRVRVSEESYLEISAGLTAGARSLGPASKRQLSSKLWAVSTQPCSRSAPVLPALPTQ